MLIRIARGDEHPQYSFFMKFDKNFNHHQICTLLFFSMTDKCVLYESAEDENGRNIQSKKVGHTSVFRADTVLTSNGCVEMLYITV